MVSRSRSVPAYAGMTTSLRHCEERSDEAIQLSYAAKPDCFASLAMTEPRLQRQCRPAPHSPAVIARLDRAIQYPRGANDGIQKPRRTGSPPTRG